MTLIQLISLIGLPLRLTQRRHFRGSASASLIIAAITLGFFSPNAPAQTNSFPAISAPALMDHQKETELALSACPTAVAGKAAVYVLEKNGYVKIRDSQNGFTAIVQHVLPNSQDPQCMDAEGTRTFLPRFLKIAEWRAQGKTPDEIKRLVADAWTRGLFQAPIRPGVDYMLSTENRTPDDKGVIVPFPPHVMFYAPYLTNADLGAEGQHGVGPFFVAGEGTPGALIIFPVGTHTGSEHGNAAPANDAK